jgi:uncharacterized protein
MARGVFADTHYWLAIFNPHDQWHPSARIQRAALGRSVRIFTTQEVLTEFLNAICEWGPHMRAQAIAMVEALRADRNVTVVPQSPESHQRGMHLFKRRADKGYSLTDCISMETMRDKGLMQVLTNDDHFTQEGFIVLIPRKPAR